MADKKPPETTISIHGYERRGFGAMDGAMRPVSQIKERPPAPAPMQPVAAAPAPAVETKAEPSKK